MKQKMFKATFYVTVEGDATADEVKEFLNDALIVDVDTEEWDNTVGFLSAEVNIDSLEQI